MAKADPKVAARVDWLRQEIRRHDRLYYALDRPEVSDAEYDALYRELVRLEAENPGLVDPASPTRRVPGAVAEGFAPFAHPVPMVSLDSVTSEQEFRDWEESIRAYLKHPAGTAIAYSVEPKIDGVSLELVYERGRLVAAATRGDGTTGEDVTPNAVTVKSIPLALDASRPPAYLAVRGEAYVRKADFAELNRRIAEAGEEPFANPRNFCAGSLRLLDPAIPAARPIRYVAYSIAKAEGASFASQGEALAALRAWGFPTSEWNAAVAGGDAVAARYRELEAARDAIAFELDGVVVKVDDGTLQQRLGLRSRSPRWAVAWKFPSRRAVTVLRDVSWSVGRTGIVSPVADLEPVSIGGVTVSSAGLFNIDQLGRLGVRVGDHVVVERAGDVIPRVVGVVPERRTGGERVPVPPDQCPSCGARLWREADEAALRCRNVACPQQVEGNVVHFASRGGLDIQGLGPKQVHQFREAGLLHDAADLFRLKKESLVALDRQGETSATNLLGRIEAAKRPPLDRLLYALGIPEIGESGAKTLARAFRTLEALAAASVEALDDLDEVGPAMAEAVHGWFSEPRNREFLARLAAEGVSPKEAAPEGKGPLSGAIVVFTGTLPTLSRDEAKQAAESAGGRIGSGISGTTTLVVAGDSAGSKLAKAKDLGIEIVDEAEFLRRVRGV